MENDYSMIFFERGAATLDSAEEAFQKQKWMVLRDREMLDVQWSEDGPMLSIHYSEGDIIAQESAEIGDGTEFEERLKKCSARFEIIIRDLDHVMDEMNTLIECQLMLLDLTRGVQFNTWNGSISVGE